MHEQNGQGPQPKDRTILVTLHEPQPGVLQVQGVGYRNMPQGAEGQWTSWKLCHDLLLAAAKVAGDEMLTHLQGQRRIQVAGLDDLPPGRA